MGLKDRSEDFDPPLNHTFDPANPCRHFIRSDLFAEKFANVSEDDVYQLLEHYCLPRRGGPLGEDTAIQLAPRKGSLLIILRDRAFRWLFLKAIQCIGAFWINLLGGNVAICG